MPVDTYFDPLLPMTFINSPLGAHSFNPPFQLGHNRTTRNHAGGSELLLLLQFRGKVETIERQQPRGQASPHQVAQLGSFFKSDDQCHGKSQQVSQIQKWPQCKVNKPLQAPQTHSRATSRGPDRDTTYHLGTQPTIPKLILLLLAK